MSGGVGARLVEGAWDVSNSRVGQECSIKVLAAGSPVAVWRDRGVWSKSRTKYVLVCGLILCVRPSPYVI